MTTLSGERRSATASYIEEMLIELRTMGQQIDCDFLVYTLEMAILEAGSIKCGTVTPGRRATPLASGGDEMSAEQLATLYMTGQFDA